MARQKILIIQTAFLGDLLLSIPLLRRLRIQMPEAEVHLLCRRGFGDLFKSLGLVEQAFEIQKRDRRSYAEALRALQSHAYEWLISPHESLTTARLVRKIKSRHKVGYARWWNFFFYKQRVRKDFSIPEALRQLSLLQFCDAEVAAKLLEWKQSEQQWSQQGVSSTLLSPVPEWATMRVKLTPTADVRQRWGLQKPFVCLFPGSVWGTKRWTEEGYVELGKKLLQQGSVVVMGGPGEETLAQQVAEKIPQAKNLAAQCSLEETLSLLEQAKLVVTNDSAGQHLAAVAGAPTVSIFGPTVLSFGFRPWNSKAIIVELPGLACRPCGKHGPQKCPLGTHECMRSLSAQTVYQACQSLLSQS